MAESAEFEELENLDDIADGADGFESLEEFDGTEPLDLADDVEATGATSAETIERSANTSDSSSGRGAILKSMSVYDAMLVASALSVALACVLMFLELTSFDGLFYQWRTGEAQINAITPP